MVSSRDCAFLVYTFFFFLFKSCGRSNTIVLQCWLVLIKRFFLIGVAFVPGLLVHICHKCISCLVIKSLFTDTKDKCINCQPLEQWQCIFLTWVEKSSCTLMVEGKVMLLTGSGAHL